MARAQVLFFLITLLAFHFLAPSNAVPLSRVQRMSMEVADKMPSVKGANLEPKVEMERPAPTEDEAAMITERMAFETQDYAPSGPNNHHKPPGWS